MATNLSSWISEVAPAVPGCPDFVIEREVLQACRIFCDETHLWEVDLTAISVIADTKDYALTAPSTGEIIKIQSVKYKSNGEDNDQYRTLNPSNVTEENRHNSGSWNYQESPEPTGFYFDHLTDTLSLYPIPTDASASGLLIRVIVTPDESAATVQDFLYQKYKKIIGFGAKYLLLEEPAVPWSNTELAVYMKGKFMNGVNNAKRRKYDGFTDQPLRVKMRRFF